MIVSEILKWVIPFICGGIISLCGTVLAMWKQRKVKTKALEEGVQCLLRVEIIRAHEKYTEKGYCPIYAKESLKRTYTAYHILGGNDIATDLCKETLALQTESKDN